MPGLPRGDPGWLLERQRRLGIDAGTYASGDGQPASPGDLVDALLTIQLTRRGRDNESACLTAPA